ncbi:hypothetical protein PHMEG_00032430 [Phytophthora megakarya]|uniref:RxLR effector protein n=1 Tax=Phytophthora megakarya TaxID=4795 RepID=A0A225UW01_9STRA|nr:hypothetical protein PHMEG_00032430 [Phytophthora megakarya]
MRALYSFLIAAVSAFAISDAISFNKNVVSPRGLPIQASVSGRRHLRADKGIEMDEERSPEIKAYANELLKIHLHDFNTNILPKSERVTLQVKNEVYKELNKLLDDALPRGLTVEYMEAKLANPTFVKRLKDDGITDDGVQKLFALVKKKTHAKVD